MHDHHRIRQYLKWQTLLQMPWQIVVGTIVTLCLEVYSCLNQHKLQSIQSTLTCNVTNHRKYDHVTPILKQPHWLPVKYHCVFKTATLVYNFLHSGSPSYFETFLSLSSCSYSTRLIHPDCQYLRVTPFHSSVFKSVKHFGHSFAFDSGRSRIYSLMIFAVQLQLPPSGKSLKLICLQLESVIDGDEVL